MMATYEDMADLEIKVTNFLMKSLQNRNEREDKDWVRKNLTCDNT